MKVLTDPVVLLGDLLGARVALVLQALLLLLAQAQRLGVRARVLPHAPVATHRDQTPRVALDLHDRPHLVPVRTAD